MKKNNDEIREASHAGSWYIGEKSKLDSQLATWLQSVDDQLKIKKIKALIGPHAGYTYSGPTAAFSYKYLNGCSDNLRVFLLGPSHHVYLKGVALSSLKTYQTPLGDIELDLDTINQLKKEGNFLVTDKETEENEHSLEMHLPYIYKSLAGNKFKLVPLMVGSLDPITQDYYSNILVKYFDDPNTIFVISSDFCHWGKRFNYTYYQKEDGKIFQSIEKLDKKAIDRIEMHDANGFVQYLGETNNTICGRNPIAILLRILEKSSIKGLKTKLLRYAQSSQVEEYSDSSVSYAACVTYLEN